MSISPNWKPRLHRLTAEQRNNLLPEEHALQIHIYEDSSDELVERVGENEANRLMRLAADASGLMELCRRSMARREKLERLRLARSEKFNWVFKGMIETSGVDQVLRYLTHTDDEKLPVTPIGIKREIDSSWRKVNSGWRSRDTEYYSACGWDDYQSDLRDQIREDIKVLHRAKKLAERFV